MSGRFSQELHHHGGGNTICPADFELLSRKLCQNDVACSDVVQQKIFFFYFKQGRKPPLVSWEAFLAFESRLLFCFFCPFFTGQFFFAVEELSSGHP